MTDTALIVVDIQSDYFSGGRWELGGAGPAVQNASRVLRSCRERGYLIVHVHHEALTFRSPYFIPYSDGVRAHRKVSPLYDEVVVVKHFINPYRDTQLSRILHDNRIKRVVVVGNTSHLGIDALTRASEDFGYPTTVIHDACTAPDVHFNNVHVPGAQVHAAFMAALQQGYATVLSADEYLL